MIQLEATLFPLSVSFKRDGVSLLTLQIASAGEPTLHFEDSSLQADFARFFLKVEREADGWVLTAASSDSAPVEIKIEMAGYWYGGGELIHQRFPLNKIMLQSAPFLTFDNSPTGLSGKLTPAWFSSNGAMMIADSPIEVGINQPPANYPRFQWTFATEWRGAFRERPFADEGEGDGRFSFKGNPLRLKFVFEENAVSAYQKLVECFGSPAEIPPEELFLKPTWTTWARYKTAVNQDVVLRFADEIIAHRYPYGVMEIDDRWQVHYGDLEFDPQKFPDPKAMIAALHTQGFHVTAWVIPFLDPQSQAFAEGAKNGWLIQNADGSPYLVAWWQGRGGLLDVTNPSALSWFFSRLKNLQDQTGLDGFKFDAGEACFLPADSVTHKKIHPNEYSQIYVDAVAEHYRLTEVRCGWKNQRAPIFFRQWDKATAWGLDNGLHSVLTGALALGLAGYPFILPDMVGGNEYEEKASAELMIRWTQLNALLPAMQFSLAPWDYGEQSAALCRRYANLHVEFAPKILEIAKASIAKGKPLVRPVFWLAPEDSRALTCDDEFLLGDEFLVAPAVVPHTTRRDVYLPNGTWQDYWTKETFEGATTLKAYPAPLDTLLIFKRINGDESHDNL